MQSLCTIILAAGNSSRFGSNKLFHIINNKPMYQYTIDLAKKINSSCTILVTKYPEITKKIDPNILVVQNTQTHLGQSHSIKLALKKSLKQSEQFRGYLFMVCDQPYLTYDSLLKLYTIWQKKQGICALSYKGKRKNPVIFSRKYLKELLSITGDVGGRAIIYKHINELTLVDILNPQELIDIDTPY